MGTTEVTDDEEENELNEATKMAARRELANIPPLQSTRIVSEEKSGAGGGGSSGGGGGKVRIPSPAREQGDGMEAVDQHPASNSPAEVKPAPASCPPVPKPKLITLPQVHIHCSWLLH